MRPLSVAVFAIAAVIATVQGQRSHSFDLGNTTSRDQLSQLGREDVNSATWTPTSVSVELLPADELRATVSDRKQIAVHVFVGEVAPPRGRSTNSGDNTTEYGCFTKSV